MRYISRTPQSCQQKNFLASAYRSQPYIDRTKKTRPRRNAGSSSRRTKLRTSVSFLPSTPKQLTFFLGRTNTIKPLTQIKKRWSWGNSYTEKMTMRCLSCRWTLRKATKNVTRKHRPRQFSMSASRWWTVVTVAVFTVAVCPFAAKSLRPFP